MKTGFLPDPQATHALGVRLGELAMAGDVLALSGDLGAGKTALVRGLAEGLGCATRVQSPTFVLVQRHQGRLGLWHADTWRLGSADELDALELVEEAGDGVLVVEWADRFPEVLPADRLEIALAVSGEGRAVAVRATGPRHARYEPELELG